ncbi:MAG: N-6 DNA methylase, partial [Anaerolineae bacterium]|nr:N-6 DNA methylase [Anaerolineae bacterium]
RLIVEIIEPFHGRILDPACGSGGMFVQSARFIEEHRGSPGGDLSIYGQEKTEQTVRLCKMNLAVHGLEGDVKSVNTYYEDSHKLLGRFDFVMANPPFNVDGVDRERLKGDKRFPFGVPTVNNANTLWIQLFYSALDASGRAGFVMANSASDARGSEQTIREALIRSGAVDVMVAIGSNFFHNVTLPCTLWFFDKDKTRTPRAGTVLFIDARRVFTQVDRAHREFSEAQLEYLANIARLYRGEAIENDWGSREALDEAFPGGAYRDVPGLCKAATLDEIAAQGWSLNPGRYVGVAAREDAEDFDFRQTMEELYERLEQLNAEAHVLEERISENMQWLLEAGE